MWRRYTHFPDYSAGQERKETGRLEALSDGVFAVALTLLVLTIPIPDVNLPHGKTLLELMRQNGDLLSLAAYVVSFVTILVMWVNHHFVFQFLGRIDRFFVFANGLLLMAIVFVNYPTALVAHYIGTSGGETAAILYNVTLIIISALYQAMWLRITVGRRLLAANVDQAEVSRLTRQYLFGGPLYVVALALAFVAPALSIALDAALAVFFAFTGQIIRTEVRTEARTPERQLEGMAPPLAQEHTDSERPWGPGNDG